MRGRNVLERKVSPPHPLFKELSSGIVFWVDIVRSTVERAMFAQTKRLKVLVKLFGELAGI